MFLQPDVDAFLDSIYYDQYCKWQMFLAAEPQGWQAINISQARIGYMIAQVNSKKQLKEKDFILRFQNGRTAAEDQARWEAQAIRSQIYYELEQKELDAKNRNTE